MLRARSRVDRDAKSSYQTRLVKRLDEPAPGIRVLYSSESDVRVCNPEVAIVPGHRETLHFNSARQLCRRNRGAKRTTGWRRVGIDLRTETAIVLIQDQDVAVHDLHSSSAGQRITDAKRRERRGRATTGDFADERVPVAVDTVNEEIPGSVERPREDLVPAWIAHTCARRRGAFLVEGYVAGPGRRCLGHHTDEPGLTHRNVQGIQAGFLQR